MSVKVFSAAIYGIEAQLIEVEVDSNPGIHSFNIVGLPDKAVEESRDRIGSAIKNSGFKPPKATNKKIVTNLAPADIKKEGPAYDLPIAVAYLLETDQVKFDFKDKIFVGELSLDGTLKPINGTLSIAFLAKKKGFKELILPVSNSREAAVIEGIEVTGVKDLSEVIGYLNGTVFPQKNYKEESVLDQRQSIPETFLAIKGQEYAKRALSIAAAGSHNILMYGPPGSGKTILAKAFSEILPRMSTSEAIEVAKIYSASGLIDPANPLSLKRPFRNPHHTTSAVAIVGGGTNPRPGEISLSHRGVLFFDELPEFPRNVLESLRQPIEDGLVTVSRASGSVVFPAKFMFVAAMNPCPCGNYGSDDKNCTCLPYSVIKYHKKVSGPLLDRLDIQIKVPRENISSSPNVSNISIDNNLQNILSSINLAREIQDARFKNSNIFSNSEINYKNIDKYCQRTEPAEKIVQMAVNQNKMSLRSYHKIIKLARTIADMDKSDKIEENHVAEAIKLRLNENFFSGTV